MEREIGGRDEAGRFLGPLDQTHGVIAEIFVQPGIGKLFWIAETIKIKVIPVYARNYVNFNQCVSRAFHGAGVPQGPEQGAHQRGLARTEVAIEPYDHTGCKQWSELAAQRHGRRFIGQFPFQRSGRAGRTKMLAMHTRHSNTAADGGFDAAALVGKIKRWGKELGFSSIGIARADVAQASIRLERWLGLGRHGEMDYMAKHRGLRARPEALVPDTVSVISARLPYWPQAADSARVLADKGAAYVARYALGRDYHRKVRQQLQRLATRIGTELAATQPDLPFSYRVFSDSAPVMEVEFAVQGGISWRGKHTLTLSRDGSWHFLGEIYTSLDLPADAAIDEHCGTCSRCIEVCPTSAIVAPYELDARLCISYLTIELHGPIPLPLRPLIGNRIYGCDDCQLCCPWNRFAKIGDPDFAVRNGLDDAKLVDLFAWDEQEFEQRLAGSPIRRIGYERWLRNIAVALGNADPTEEIRTALLARRDHPSALVREHVAWALARVAGTDW